MRGVTWGKSQPIIRKSISTHTPHARRDVTDAQGFQTTSDFNSHASCEAWHYDESITEWLQNFNSHASCEAWRKKINEAIAVSSNFNSHASCEAWLSSFTTDTTSQKISTHTPHARRDHRNLNIPNVSRYFNSHASCEAWREPCGKEQCPRQHFNSHASCEAWHSQSEKRETKFSFQLTRLMRGVTKKISNTQNFKKFQLTRLMRGVTEIQAKEVTH